MSSSCINDRLLQYKNDRSEASLKQLMEAASRPLRRCQRLASCDVGGGQELSHSGGEN